MKRYPEYQKNEYVREPLYSRIEGHGPRKLWIRWSKQSGRKPKRNPTLMTKLTR